MATPFFCCGFECRAFANGETNHWTGSCYTGEVTIQNTYARNGGYALRIACTAHATNYAAQPIRTIPYGTVRFYLYFVTLPGADVDCLVEFFDGTIRHVLGYTQSTSKLNVGQALGTKTAASSTVSAGVWYRIDVLLDFHVTSPHLIDWQIDGTAQTQVSVTGSDSTQVYTIYFGDRTTATTVDVCYDDVLVSSASGDYPLGAGYTVGYRPGATSGTHNQTAGDLQNEASTNVTNADSSGGKVNEAAADTTSYVKQVIARSTTYWEGIYATSGAPAAPRAVDQIVATRAVSAGANDQKAQLYDGTSAADAYALTSTPNATLLYQRKQWGTAPSTGAWTLAKFQAACIRWGFSTTNTATYPPAISWTMLEAEYAGDPANPPVWTTPADTVAMSTTPVLEFTMPTLASAMHFHMELDTAATFDTGNLRTLKTNVDQTGWTYWDGDSWEAVPAGGVSSTYGGNAARYTVTSALSSATWYRRVRAGT